MTDIIEMLMENPKKFVALVFALIFGGLGIVLNVDIFARVLLFGFACLFLLDVFSQESA